MNVIGLDLSLTAPGLAAALPLGKVAATTLVTDAKRGDRRFCDIRDWLMHYVAAYRMQLAVVEAVPPYDHASSGLERVHGIAREVLARYDVPFAYVNVTALKSYATGNGRADKAAVMAAASGLLGWTVADDNEADALILMQMGREFLASDRDGVGVNDAMRQAMSAVAWPIYANEPGWPQPYGPIRRKAVVKKCRHGIMSLRNGETWLHPFTVAACDKPPTGRTR